METKNIKIKDLATNDGQIEGLPKNPRQIRDHRYEKLKKSIEDAPEMLQLRELLVYPHGGKFVIIGGNMRYRACKELGYKELPCKVLDADTTPEKLREYAIKDNESFGQYDWDLVANEWDADEITDWGVELPIWDEDAENGGEEKETAKEDDFDENANEIEKRCNKGEIWKLGVHRLMCGDSTNAADVALLMNGERADVCFTSPPYNVGLRKDDKKYTKGGTMYNEYADQLTDSEYKDLLHNALKNALQYADDALFNIGFIATTKKAITLLLGNYVDKICDIIVWNRGNGVPTGMKGILKHYAELIFCFNQDGKRNFTHPQFDAGTASNVIDVPPNTNNEYASEHHATFPVALASEICTNFTSKSILDLFGGTGTTLIAAEQLNRKCFMMELDPHYCDIILARWEKLTGQQAEKLC